MARTIDRVIVIVLDSVGVGALPDAQEYGDAGSDTLGHTAAAVNGLRLANLCKLGLGNLHPIRGVDPVEHPEASWGKMAEMAKGKDTITGHWELMGLVIEEPFALFPNGFSEEVLREFRAAAGVSGILGNKTASGTAIIEELGAEHLKTGSPIVYTSADSVFQIAAHEDIIPLPRLYRMCEAARRIGDRLRIGRIIARPFIGSPGSFKRTYNRRDYPMLPTADTVLDRLNARGLPVVGIGKIDNIFAGRGLSKKVHTEGNRDGVEQLLAELAATPRGLIFANLIDFDMLYGHRNDAAGYAMALEEFDHSLALILCNLGEKDCLIITADHGCDPTTPGSDHTREYVPLLVYAQPLAPRPLGIRRTFADVGATILDIFGVDEPLAGESFWPRGK